MFRFLFILTFSFAVNAQVLMTDSGDKKSLKISKMDVKVRTYGFLAETVMTMTFDNPNFSTLIGNFYLNIPKRTTITGYGLDVNGVMVDAVAVEKIRARKVFEAITRIRIDPGLLEWIQGNYFKTRVYPIPSKGERTIQIKMLTEMERTPKGFFYELPFNLQSPVFDFRLDIKCENLSVQPSFKSDVIDKITFEKKNRSMSANLQRRNFEPGFVQLEIPSNKSSFTMIEEGSDGHFYMAWGGDIKPTNKERKIGEKIGVLWDASLSRTKTDLDKDIAFLKEVMNKVSSVHFTVFHTAFEETKVYEVKNGECPGLINKIKQLNYDGGTSLTSADLIKYSNNVEELLIFSDCMSGLTNELFRKEIKKPFFVINSSPLFDSQFFKSTAKSQGLLIDLRSLSSKDAFKKITNEHPIFWSVDDMDFYPRNTTKISNFFSVAGKKKEIQGKFSTVLNLTEDKKLNFNKDDVVSGDLIKAFYSRKKLEDLINHDGSKDEIIQHGLNYHLVTPHTSLIVLETIDQYLAYRIEPPKTFPVMRQRYLENIDDVRVIKPKTISDNISDALYAWDSYRDWYNQEFNFPEDFKWSRRVYPIPDTISAGLLEMTESASADGIGAGGGDLGGGDLIGGIDDSADGSDAPDSKDEQVRTVTVKRDPWKAASDEMKKMLEAKDSYLYYLELRKKYSKSVDFYLDAADVFFQKKQFNLAERIASNVSELTIGNSTNLRALAFTLMKHKNYKKAIEVYKRIKALRPDEPQSWRDLALCYEANKQYGESLRLLENALEREFPRFNIKANLIAELNRILLIAPEQKATVNGNFVDPQNMDLKVILTWNSDNIDLNLAVREPSGESIVKAGFTTIGGFKDSNMSSYGPESYMLKHAIQGEYFISVYDAFDTSQSVAGSVRARLDIYTNYGRANQKHTVQYLKLKDGEAKTSIIFDDNKKITNKKKRPVYYITTPQDNILRMAVYMKNFGVEWSEFRELNKAVDWDAIKPGMKLLVPEEKK